ncbi:ATPase MORC2-like isoform X1 [Argopecten irradians]|uniref:ATPase MORC2-like isoform X1 n=1 Tax=Argopecten irradians TaxID=31199 RepID=UPI0037153874
MAQNYSNLSRAQLSFDYLHTNSTTHEFLFGALAELVDNARDASATRMDIFTIQDEELRGEYMLCFLDDGEGMDPNDTADIVTFGRSTKRSLDSPLIGMYGNGLKSGSMRIGNDLMLFTKKGVTMSCLFLSRTFHEEEGIDEVIVPLPSFDVNTRNATTPGPKHDMEMELILKYSPFTTEEEFFAQFDKIEGSSGTLVIVYNMKLLDNGEPELDITSDSEDILLANPTQDFDSDEGLMPERKSFRAYASILYVDPRMKIYIQGKKVRTKKLMCSLYKPKLYKYSSNRFKTRSENEVQRAKDEAKQAEHKVKELESKAKHLENKQSGSISKDQRTELRKAQSQAAEFRRIAEYKKQVADRKAKSLKDPKILNFVFGINLENRNHDGIFVYNCSRLIKMYEKVGPQTDGGVFCSGVVGVVDIPYLVLEPTHNKQDFADAKEYRHMMKAMGEHMTQYWKDIGIAQQGVTKFWENFGYVSQRWKDPPSEDNKYARKRAMQINVTLQCDLCLKWRTLPFSSNNIGKDFPDDWVCAINPDVAHNRCSSAEQKMNISEGVFKKAVKSQDQKQKDIEEAIKKKAKELEKMQKHKPVMSSRQLAEMDRKRKEEEDRKRREEERKRKEEERERQEEERLAQLKAAREAAAKKAAARRAPPSPPPAKKAASASKSRAPIRSPTVTSTPRVTSTQKPRSESKSKPEPKVTTTKPSPTKPTPRTSRNSSDAAESEALTTKRRSTAVSSLDMEEEEIVPAKRAKAFSSESDSDGSATSTRTKPIAGIFTESDSEPTPAKKRGRGTKPDKEESSSDEMEVSETSTEIKTDTEETNQVSYNDADSNAEIGTKVEALVSSKWYPGVVVKVNSTDGKWKVKFDNNPKDKYDKWFDKSSSEIRLKSGQPIPESQPPSSPASSQDTAAEAPSSSTTTTTTGAAPSSQITEEIANGYRTSLRYFLPPQWVMDKDAISTMSLEELAAFPLDDFFDHYEKGLRKLVGNFQTEATQRKQECEASTAKLSAVRKLIAKLLKSINEEFDIDPEADGEQVDELLAACVKQAVQSQP